jgi:hypothetical protein
MSARDHQLLRDLHVPPRRIAALTVVGALLLGGCGGSDDGVDGAARPPAAPTQRFRYPPAPVAPVTDASDPTGAETAIDRIVDGIRSGALDPAALDDLAATGDVRHAWMVSDLLRFFGGAEGEQLLATFEQLTDVSLDDDPDLQVSAWLSSTNHLIAWDTPSYPGYREDKAGIFLVLEPGWEPFFADADAHIDWRHLNWGGVFIDDRPLGDTAACPGGCVPALDDPPTTDAAGGEWYPDDAIVFGIVEAGEALALPKNIAEVHEMFNLTLGGRRLGIPYCTLCGSAQAYRTDVGVDGTEFAPALVLRTSGLLNRSNKVMYDLGSQSVFDTFTGAAVSGPLQDAKVVLAETTVVTSTWGGWKTEHPGTAIVAADGGIGRDYPLEPLGGRDDDGPIFPIGAADERLDVHELVVGVVLEDGSTVAFPSATASAVLSTGGTVELAGVELFAAGDGVVAVGADGTPRAAHESFWFAWSQFHPDTRLWEAPAG